MILDTANSKASGLFRAVFLLAVCAAPAPVFSQLATDAKVDPEKSGSELVPGVSRNDEVVELTPFTVSASANIGYQANDTLAGSRMRTDLSDIASSVSVFTPELISDLAATSEADLLRYSAAAQPERTDQTPGVQGINPLMGDFSFRIRGQTASRARNYFQTYLIPDSYNAESFEEARGPNSILFGVAGAGGVFNTSTKRARLNHDATRLGLTISDHQGLRGTVDLNRAIGEKFAVRVNGVAEDADSWQPNAHTKNRRLAFAATYRVFEKLSLSLDTEYGKWAVPISRYFAPFDMVSLWKQNGSPEVANGVLAATAAQRAMGIGNRNANNQRITLVGNDNTFRNFQGTAISLPIAPTANASSNTLTPDLWTSVAGSDPYPSEANFGGSGGHVDFEQGGYTLFAESEPIKNLFVEFAASHDEQDHKVYDPVPEQAFGNSFNGVWGEPGQTYRDGSPNPYAGSYYVDTRWVLRQQYYKADRYRLTTAYSIDLGERWGRHNFAALVSRDRSDSPRYTSFLALEGAPFNANPTAAQNLVYSRYYVTDPGDMNQYSSVPSYGAIMANPISVQLNNGSAATTYRAVWGRQSSSEIIQIERAAMFSMQNYFFKERLVVTSGMRRTLNFQQFSTTQSSSNSLNTSSVGAVLKITPWLSTFYNRSENALAPTSVQTVIPYNGLIPVNSGEGKDMGVMLKLLQGKVFVRAGYYDTTSLDQTKAAGVAENIVTRNRNITAAMLAAGLTVPPEVLAIDGGGYDSSDVYTKGYELSVTANLTESWRLTLSATKSDSTSENLLKLSTGLQPLFLPVWQTPAAQTLVTAGARTVAQEVSSYQLWYDSGVAGNGKSTVGHSPFQARVFTRYEFKNDYLKGAYVGGGYSYNDAPVIGFNTTTGADYYGPVLREADFLVGYKTRLPVRFGRRTTLTFQFNAQNILQQNVIIPISALGDGQLLRAVVVAPTRYVFSTRLDF